jgi:hypothetical protein
MNQPPGGGYPPGPQYPGQPGAPPQQGYPQQQPQQAQPQVGQPSAAKPFMGTALMPGAPGLPPEVQAQIAAAQAAQNPQAQAQPQQAYGAQPQQGYPGAPQGAPQGGYPGGPPQAGYPGAPQQGAYPGAAQGPQGAYPGAPPQGGYPGAPQQPQQQGVVPNIGIGGFGAGGMPQLNFSGGMSRGNLIAAVIGGQGFAKPRMMGLGLIGLSFVFGIANTVLVLVLHRYYMYLYSAGAIFGWCGTWMAITGQPKAQPDNSKAPMWGRAGLMVCFVIGTLVGIALSVFNWEALLFNAAVDQVNQ